MREFNEIDRRILDAMDGKERLKVLLQDAGYPTLQDFARATGLWTQQISMCLAGARPYPEIRKAMAKKLGVAVRVVDEMIDGEKAA